jgi:3-oxo-5-alpha-steroid 4-dehydrogenase 1
MQWVTSWYGAGKTSADSKFNIPGKIAWLTMEAPGFCTLLYIMNTLPAETGLASLPLENKIMGSLFVFPIPLPRSLCLAPSASHL